MIATFIHLSKVYNNVCKPKEFSGFYKNIIFDLNEVFIYKTFEILPYLLLNLRPLNDVYSIHGEYAVHEVVVLSHVVY